MLVSEFAKASQGKQSVSDQAPSKNLWESLEEPGLPADEIELLFAQRPTKGKDEETGDQGADKKQKKEKIEAFTALDGKRAQSVGILMGSCKKSMEELARAVYHMDVSVCRLEIIKSLYEQRATDEELVMMRAHAEGLRAAASGPPHAGDAAGPAKAPLAKTDEFLLQLAGISHFQLRVECWLFTESFSERVFEIKEGLETLRLACTSLHASGHVQEVLGIVLACGNYMNGGTNRGQADGFHLDVLTKLRDVKTQDNTSHLLQFVVALFVRRLDEARLLRPASESQSATPDEVLKGETETEGAKPWESEGGKPLGSESDAFPLPDPVQLRGASLINLEDSERAVGAVEKELATCRRKVERVLADTSTEDLLQPFKSGMERFLERASASLEEIKASMAVCQADFDGVVAFFCFTTKADKPTPQEFFEVR